MKRERPRCEDCIYNDNYNEDVPCGAKIGEPIEYCFRPKETDYVTLKKEAMKMAAWARRRNWLKRLGTILKI